MHQNIDASCELGDGIYSHSPLDSAALFFSVEMPSMSWVALRHGTLSVVDSLQVAGDGGGSHLEIPASSVLQRMVLSARQDQ